MSFNNAVIIDLIDPLPDKVYEYTRIDIEPVKKTSKAVMIWYEGEERWIPLSVLKVDKIREIWMANWFIEKEKIYL